LEILSRVVRVRDGTLALPAGQSALTRAVVIKFSVVQSKRDEITCSRKGNEADDLGPVRDNEVSSRSLSIIKQQKKFKVHL